MSLLLSLLLFSTIQIESCGESVTLMHQNQRMTIQLFNILYNDQESIEKACSYLEKADKIELIEEPLVKDAYYIKVDGQIFQEIIIEQDWGRIEVAFPEYLYLNEKEEEAISVMSHAVVKTTSFHSIGILVGMAFLVGILLIIGYKL